jgi:hypothetical protein
MYSAQISILPTKLHTSSTPQCETPCPSQGLSMHREGQVCPAVVALLALPELAERGGGFGETLFNSERTFFEGRGC